MRSQNAKVIHGRSGNHPNMQHFAVELSELADRWRRLGQREMNVRIKRKIEIRKWNEMWWADAASTSGLSIFNKQPLRLNGFYYFPLFMAFTGTSAPPINRPNEWMNETHTKTFKEGAKKSNLIKIECMWSFNDEKENNPRDGNDRKSR